MKRNKKRSFFTFLVQNYIFFTISIAVAIAGLASITLHRINNVLKEPKVKDVIDYASLMSREEYGEIPVEYLLGKGAYIQVLDENNNYVYESDPSKPKEKFTKGELECIQNYSPHAEIYVQDYLNDKKDNNTCVSIYYNNADRPSKIYLVDKDLNLIYTNTDTKIEKFTNREYKYLVGKYPKGYDVRKYSFKDKKGKNLTLIMHIPSVGEETYNKINRISEEAFASFLLIYIVLIGLFVFWMNRKVKKPLNILNKAIVGFKNGARKNYVHYDGPQEFSDICESFNDMSKKLYESEKKREELEEEKKKMLADISHDLKTPITVIKGYSKAVCDNLVSEDEKEQYLMTVYQKADNLDELINTFYEYSKMEHPDYKLTLEKVNICEYTRAYLAQIYDELYIAGIDVEADIPEETFYCNVDRVQLKRVFENIVSNAVKHNKKGITILFEVIKLDDKIKIIIADNGSGIPKDIAANIFDAFVVGEKSRTKKGSGLGLALGKKIVEAHGGSIKLISGLEDYKTVFEILLPLCK